MVGVGVVSMEVFPEEVFLLKEHTCKDLETSNSTMWQDTTSVIWCPVVWSVFGAGEWWGCKKGQGGGGRK